MPRSGACKLEVRVRVLSKPSLFAGLGSLPLLVPPSPPQSRARSSASLFPACSMSFWIWQFTSPLQVLHLNIIVLPLGKKAIGLNCFTLNKARIKRINETSSSRSLLKTSDWLFAAGRRSFWKLIKNAVHSTKWGTGYVFGFCAAPNVTSQVIGLMNFKGFISEIWLFIYDQASLGIWYFEIQMIIPPP